MNKAWSILILILSGLLSIIIGTAWVNYGAAELAVLIYVVIPVLVIIVTVLLYLLIPNTIISKKSLLIILILVNILTGVLMRLDFYFHILGL